MLQWVPSQTRKQIECVAITSGGFRHVHITFIKKKLGQIPLTDMCFKWVVQTTDNEDPKIKVYNIFPT